MKRTPLVRSTPSTPQTTPSKRSPLSRGATAKLSRQSQCFLKKPIEGKTPQHRHRPATGTAQGSRAAALSCARCGITRSSPAAPGNRHQDGKGDGTKAQCHATVPLCCSRPGISPCHAGHEPGTGMTREAVHGRPRPYSADTRQKPGVRP